MKVDFKNDKIIVYLYDFNLNINNADALNEKIKDLIIMIIKKYKVNFFGYSKIVIYNNEKYGSIIEILPIVTNDFSFNTIDLKIVVYKNTPMYLELDNCYSLEMFKKVFIKNNKYYLNINNIENIAKYIELGKIIY